MLSFASPRLRILSPPGRGRALVSLTLRAPEFVAERAARREGVGRPHQAVEDSGLVEHMAAVGDDMEHGLGPGLVQFPGGGGRRAAIVAALDDHSGYAPQPVRVAEQLAVLHPAAVDHIVILD